MFSIHFLHLSLLQRFKSRIFVILTGASLGIIFFFKINTCESFSDVQSINQVTNDFKYILLWTDYDYAPFYFFEEGQKSFIKNNCSVTNCYIFTNKTMNLFKGDITEFHAVAFNGRNLAVNDLPKKRSLEQKYIYINTESADNYPVCYHTFDGFFNWTATYKLNSDIPFPYISIKDKQGEIVGPKPDMRWPEMFSDVNETFSAKTKTKAVAWFVSSCWTRSHRKRFAEILQEALKVYGLAVDIYGDCGKLKCPKFDKICDVMLKRDYFFYLSLENTFAEDYVTEKLLRALQNDVVPIVSGGANYSKFIPPGSYLDSKKIDTPALAALIVKLMKSPEMYQKFFNWKSHYSYSDPSRTENVCALCAALNDEKKFNTKTVYNQFRRWWNPDYKKRCRQAFTEHIVYRSHAFNGVRFQGQKQTFYTYYSCFLFFKYIPHKLIKVNKHKS